MKKALWALLVEEDGQGLVEYSLIVAMISVVAFGALNTLAGDLMGPASHVPHVLK